MCPSPVGNTNSIYLNNQSPETLTPFSFSPWPCCPAQNRQNRRDRDAQQSPEAGPPGRGLHDLEETTLREPLLPSPINK